jgi:hypothetical protein
LDLLQWYSKNSQEVAGAVGAVDMMMFWFINEDEDESEGGS